MACPASDRGRARTISRQSRVAPRGVWLQAEKHAPSPAAEAPTALVPESLPRGAGRLQGQARVLIARTEQDAVDAPSRNHALGREQAAETAVSTADGRAWARQFSGHGHGRGRKLSRMGEGLGEPCPGQIDHGVEKFEVRGAGQPVARMMPVFARSAASRSASRNGVEAAKRVMRVK